MEDTAIDLLAPVHRLSVARYMEMGEAGLFDPDVRVELIDGVIVEMSPQNRPHALVIGWLIKAIVPQLPPELMAMPQLPAPMRRLRSVPEPDLWVAPEAELRGDEVVPLLVIEASDSSLRYDRLTKARLYARQGVPDYWIVNIPEGVVEVLRSPSGDAWGERTVHGAGATLRPLRLDGVEIELDALFAFVGD